MNYRFIRDKNGWQYQWQTTRTSKDQKWLAEEISPKGKTTRSRYFGTRAAARRCAFRWHSGRARKNEQQRQRARCNMCDEHVKLKGDYLCGKCRYGA